MLRRLSADDERFKTVRFSSGLNLLVARTTPVSHATDSRNGAGKSSLIELLHFLLGGGADAKQVAAHPALRRTAFTLCLDWPGITEPLSVSRSGADAKQVTVRPGLASQDASPGLFPVSAAPDAQVMPVSEWKALIERHLFGLKGNHQGVSGRSLLAFLMRRIKDHGFNEPVRSVARQSEAKATPNLAYLLGLDFTLAARYQEIAAKKATRDQLKKAVDDPVWGKVIGKTADLRGEIAVRSSRIAELQGKISAFRVVPQYEELKDRADELTRRIQDLGTRDVIDRRNLDHLEKAVAEAVDPEVRYLEQAYGELGVALPAATLRSFDEVRAFHAAVVRNRRTYLGAEIEAARRSLANRREERARLDTELSMVLRELSEGGALDRLTALQKLLAQEEAKLGALRHRLEVAQTVEASSREIEAARLDLEREVEADLRERQRQVDQAIVLFNGLVSRLYGDDQSYLYIGPGKYSLKIEPKVSRDASHGIHKMAIFCFDLTMAVIAHREHRGPDFLVHDSHIFDGVDDRQLARALEVAAEIMDAEGMQYLVTINEDDLDKARRRNFTADPYVIEPMLTDSSDDGGLFGFHFER
ncbi:ABC-three component system protein [Streptomyces xiamenensis]|uniref:ABC-three component system protein n=1 Tax=Streptomyces xiamenensis TaxID=408015 RepID=UPI00368CB837